MDAQMRYGNDVIFRTIDKMAERIHQYAVEPEFAQEIRRREAEPSFDLDDDAILKRMILLIAFSQQVRSAIISDIVHRGVFERVFLSFCPADVATIDPKQLRELYWDNPSKPNERLAPLRFPGKLTSMVECAKSLQQIASRHGSFMRFLQLQQLPIRIRSRTDADQFWIAFEKTRLQLTAIGTPFFNKFTSLCHLLQYLGFDCAKPDSVVMDVGARLGIVAKPATTFPEADRRTVVQTMQLYSAAKGIRTGVVDLYFLIHGGQTDAQKYVTPAYYGEVGSLGG
ncbi:MAG: hypothetical protein WD894_24845 [Pirellulales bacterium]